jgi:hypothetical protein
MNLKAKIGWALFSSSFLVWVALFFIIPGADSSGEVIAKVAMLGVVSEILLWTGGLFLGISFVEKRRAFFLGLFRRRGGRGDTGSGN